MKRHQDTVVAVPEREVMRRILRHFATRDEIRLWRASVGVARTLDGERVRQFGLAGQADLSGIVRGSGRRLEIECKAEKGRQSREQVAYGRMITTFGGIYIVARRELDVYLALDAEGIVLKRWDDDGGGAK